MEHIELVQVSGEFVPDRFVGFSEALELIWVSRSTFYRDIKTGKVPYERSEDGVRRYRLSDLERVYGPLGRETNLVETPGDSGTLVVVCLVGLLAQQAVYQQQQIDMLAEHLNAQKRLPAPKPWWTRLLGR